MRSLTTIFNYIDNFDVTKRFQNPFFLKYIITHTHIHIILGRNKNHWNILSRICGCENRYFYLKVWKIQVNENELSINYSINYVKFRFGYIYAPLLCFLWFVSCSFGFLWTRPHPGKSPAPPKAVAQIRHWWQQKYLTYFWLWELIPHYLWTHHLLNNHTNN